MFYPPLKQTAYYSSIQQIGILLNNTSICTHDTILLYFDLRSISKIPNQEKILMNYC